MTDEEVLELNNNLWRITEEFKSINIFNMHFAYSWELIGTNFVVQRDLNSTKNTGLFWFLRDNKNLTYKRISFEEVLQSVPSHIQLVLIFNLDLFR